MVVKARARARARKLKDDGAIPPTMPHPARRSSNGALGSSINGAKSSTTALSSQYGLKEMFNTCCLKREEIGK